jgi:hypothetical protein
MDKTSVRKAEPDAPFRLIDFSAIVLIIAGILRVIDAIWAFSYHGALLDGLRGALPELSLQTYGK